MQGRRVHPPVHPDPEPGQHLRGPDRQREGGVRHPGGGLGLPPAQDDQGSRGEEARGLGRQVCRMTEIGSYRIQYILACHLQIDADPDLVPDPGYHFDEDPGADPEAEFYLMRIRTLIFKLCGSGFGSTTPVTVCSMKNGCMLIN
jgi:hypothetical protein